jgi:hypothetical protein
MKYRIAILNFCIVFCYFMTYLVLTWNTSGGDIFLIFIYLLSLSIHIITVVTIYFRRKEILLQALSGIGIAAITCFFVYKIIEHRKSQIKPTIDTSNHSIINVRKYWL